METSNTPNFLSQFAGSVKFDNTKTIQKTESGLHSIKSATSKLSKQGNPMVEIEFVHKRVPEFGIKDFLQTSQADKWNRSFDRIKYLMKAVGITSAEMPSINPYVGIYVDAEGNPAVFSQEAYQAGTIKEVLVANYTAESIATLKEVHGDSLDILKIDVTDQAKAFLLAQGLVTADTIVEKIGVAVYMDKDLSVQYCNAIASLIESKKADTFVDLTVKPNKDNFLKIRNYSEA